MPEKVTQLKADNTFTIAPPPFFARIGAPALFTSRVTSIPPEALVLLRVFLVVLGIGRVGGRLLADHFRLNRTRRGNDFFLNLRMHDVNNDGVRSGVGV